MPPAEPSTPAQAAEAAFRAHDAGDWTRFLALVHPDALAEFRRAVLRHAETERFILDHADTFAHWLPADVVPDSPSGALLRLLGVESWAQAEALSPEALFGRYLRSGDRDRAHEAVAGSSAEDERVVLGAVDENESISHVVFLEPRADFPTLGDGGTPEIKHHARVLTVKRDDASRWRVMLNGGLFFDDTGGFSMGYDPADRGEDDGGET